MSELHPMPPTSVWAPVVWRYLYHTEAVVAAASRLSNSEEFRTHFRQLAGLLPTPLAGKIVEWVGDRDDRTPKTVADVHALFNEAVGIPKQTKPAPAVLTGHEAHLLVVTTMGLITMATEARSDALRKLLEDCRRYMEIPAFTGMPELSKAMDAFILYRFLGWPLPPTMESLHLLPFGGYAKILARSDPYHMQLREVFTFVRSYIYK